MERNTESIIWIGVIVVLLLAGLGLYASRLARMWSPHVARMTLSLHPGYTLFR